MRRTGIAASVLAFAVVLGALVAQTQPTFTNPLLPSGADPWITEHGAVYYYMQTTGGDLTVWKTSNPVQLQSAEKKTVWRPPQAGAYSKEIWAPEIHYLSGKWYIYFAADNGDNTTHRIWVLENGSADPFEGTWTMKGKVNDPSDHWGIDATVLQMGDRMYMAWSGWPGDTNGEQDIFIAPLDNPWTITRPRVRLTRPQYGWEKHGDLPENKHLNVNEGPEFLVHGSRVFLSYSASACWTDDYALGMIEANTNANLLQPSSWRKSPRPVFGPSHGAQTYGLGHNGFFKSPDGKEDWIVYHANEQPGQGCGTNRQPRAQKFTWTADGRPNFGTPAPLRTPLTEPSGIQ
jgi:GH43 family beta-xylosidase